MIHTDRFFPHFNFGLLHQGVATCRHQKCWWAHVSGAAWPVAEEGGRAETVVLKANYYGVQWVHQVWASCYFASSGYLQVQTVRVLRFGKYGPERDLEEKWFNIEHLSSIEEYKNKNLSNQHKQPNQLFTTKNQEFQCDFKGSPLSWDPPNNLSVGCPIWTCKYAARITRTTRTTTRTTTQHNKTHWNKERTKEERKKTRKQKQTNKQTKKQTNTQRKNERKKQTI